MNEAVKDIDLRCKANVNENSLDLTYELTNRSSRDIYLLELIPSMNLETKEPVIDYNIMHINWRESGALYILKGIAPTPVGKRVMHMVIPLAAKIESNGELKRTVSIPLPLKEANPYYLPLETKDADEASIDRIVFSVQIVRDTLEGFKVEATELDPNIFWVRAKRLLVEREEISCGITLKQMPILKFKEAFPRL